MLLLSEVLDRFEVKEGAVAERPLRFGEEDSDVRGDGLLGLDVEADADADTDEAVPKGDDVDIVPLGGSRRIDAG